MKDLYSYLWPLVFIQAPDEHQVELMGKPKPLLHAFLTGFFKFVADGQVPVGIQGIRSSENLASIDPVSNQVLFFPDRIGNNGICLFLQPKSVLVAPAFFGVKAAFAVI